VRRAERSSTGGKETFETGASYILDKLKEMLLYRVERNSWTAFLRKHRGLGI
jgi:hypothetical protein